MSKNYGNRQLNTFKIENQCNLVSACQNKNYEDLVPKHIEHYPIKNK